MALKQPGESYGAAWEVDHAVGRWLTRGAGDANLLARWEEAVAVDSPRESFEGDDTRYHPETDTLLVASYGAITTVIRLSDRPAWEREYVHDQLEDSDL